MNHEKRCDNGCIRRMDIEKCGEGNFSYYLGTLDCPAQVEPESCECEVISLCGCCSFDDGISMTVDKCRYRNELVSWAECECHNTPIIYSTCLSKRNHSACPYGLKGDGE